MSLRFATLLALALALLSGAAGADAFRTLIDNVPRIVTNTCSAVPGVPSFKCEEGLLATGAKASDFVDGHVADTPNVVRYSVPPGVSPSSWNPLTSSKPFDPETHAVGVPQSDDGERSATASRDSGDFFLSLPSDAEMDGWPAGSPTVQGKEANDVPRLRHPKLAGLPINCSSSTVLACAVLSTGNQHLAQTFGGSMNMGIRCYCCPSKTPKLECGDVGSTHSYCECK